jgi:hypothetical protein
MKSGLVAAKGAWAIEYRRWLIMSAYRMIYVE